MRSPAFAAVALAAMLARRGPAQATPSLAETKRWLEREAPSLMRATQTSTGSAGVSFLEIMQVTDVRLDSCVMMWKVQDTLVTINGSSRSVMASVYRYSIRLKNLSVGGLLLDESTAHGSGVQYVRIRPRVGLEGGAPRPQEDLQLYVSNKADGARVLAGVKRAAVLCGAPSSPF